MFKASLAFAVVVSALLVMTGSSVSGDVPNLPKGSKVFIAPMDGFETYFRTATKAADYPLVFVRTRAEADYEVTGTTTEVRPDVEGVSDKRMTRQDTAITIRNIKSGVSVYTHTVRTEITSPNEPALVRRATRTRTPSNLLHTGRQTAATNSAAALRTAMNN